MTNANHRQPAPDTAWNRSSTAWFAIAVLSVVALALALIFGAEPIRSQPAPLADTRQPAEAVQAAFSETDLQTHDEVGHYVSPVTVSALSLPARSSASQAYVSPQPVR